MSEVGLVGFRVAEQEACWPHDGRNRGLLVPEWQSRELVSLRIASVGGSKFATLAICGPLNERTKILLNPGLQNKEIVGPKFAGIGACWHQNGRTGKWFQKNELVGLRIAEQCPCLSQDGKSWSSGLQTKEYIRFKNGKSLSVLASR